MEKLPGALSKPQKALMKNREIYLIPKSTATLTQSRLLTMLLQPQRQKGSELAQRWSLTRAHGATTGRRWRRGFGAIKISDAVWKSARSLERVVVEKNRAFAFLGTFNAANHQLPLIVRFVQSSAQRPWNLWLQNSTTAIRRFGRRLTPHL
jgi:hypothetical protein